MQVEQLSSQVAEQARMIQQLQTQALTPHANQAGQPSAQEPVAHPARSAARQDPEQAAVRPSRTGARSAHTLRKAMQLTLFMHVLLQRLALQE